MSSGIPTGLAKSPAVSIVMSCKNAAPWLEDCLESILAQDFADWELVAVNNFSTDETATILDAYQKKDKRVRLIQSAQDDLISALSTAVFHSRGKWLTRMDADDLMTPNRVRLMLEAAKSHTAKTLVVAQVRYFSADGVGEGYKRYENWLNDLSREGMNWRDIYKECPIPSPCWLCSRKDFDAVGGFAAAIYPEDYDLAFRFYQHGMIPVSVNELCLHWRDHSTRTSRVDPNYQERNYIPLKVRYFLAIDHEGDRPLALWGAGRKGKAIAKELHEAGIPFHWFCNQERKWNRDQFNTLKQPIEKMWKLTNAQHILAVAIRDAQQEMTTDLRDRNLAAGKDYWWFC